MSGFKAVKLIDTAGNPQGVTIGDGVLTTQSYLNAVAEGYIPGHTIFRKTGYTDASSATETTLWNPSTQYVFPTANISVEAVSTSASDTSAGTGIRTAHLTYLDSTYTEKTFTFTMNGVTPVAGPTDFFRVNTFHAETTGSGGKSAGVVSLRLVGGAATVYSQMPVGSTRSRSSVYTVPLGKTLYIHDVMFSASYKTSGKTVRMILHTSVTPDGVVSTTGLTFWPQYEAMLVDSNITKVDGSPIICPAKTDLKVSVIGETLAQCTSSLDGWLE